MPPDPEGGRDPYDICIVGGGINGCAIARDAAGRGFRTLLVEKDDLASGTSSGSTKLIHGGLRYLEFLEFRLVREALSEREILWRNAPHIVRPMRFVLPHVKGLRPAWILRLGLFLYDHIGGRKLLPPTRTLDLAADPMGVALKPCFRTAFEYSDCRVDDARLVVLNARDAADRGAGIRTRTRLVAARGEKGFWSIDLDSGGSVETVQARLLVNAAGPWVDDVLANAVHQSSLHNVRLVQGSHIVVRKLYDDARACIFQNEDGRVIFAIPYEKDFTLIGTTDIDFSGDPDHVDITPAEVDYLCAAASRYFARQIRREDIVWSYAAIRPLFDDGASSAQQATRDYVLKVDATRGPPLISVLGGKITTCRRLAEAMLVKIEYLLGARSPAWTTAAPLPGGDFDPHGVGAETERLISDRPFLPTSFAARLIRQYGTRAWRIMRDATSLDDLGNHFGADLYEAEVNYLVDQEWARTAEDIVWRRTKLGLVLTGPEVSRLREYLKVSTNAPCTCATEKDFQ